MGTKEGIIFNKFVEFIVDKIGDDIEIYSFGSRVKGRNYNKKDFDILIVSKKARHYHGQSVAKTFYKEYNLIDDDGKKLGEDVFLDLQFSTVSNLSEKQSNILFKNRIQIKY